MHLNLSVLLLESIWDYAALLRKIPKAYVTVSSYNRWAIRELEFLRPFTAMKSTEKLIPQNPQLSIYPCKGEYLTRAVRVLLPSPYKPTVFNLEAMPLQISTVFGNSSTFIGQV